MKIVVSKHETEKLFCCTPYVHNRWVDYIDSHEPNIDEVDCFFFIDVALTSIPKLKQHPPEGLFRLEKKELIDIFSLLQSIAIACNKQFEYLKKPSKHDPKFRLLGKSYRLPIHRISPPELQLWRLSLLLAQVQELIEDRHSLDIFVSDCKFTELERAILNEACQAVELMLDDSNLKRIYSSIENCNEDEDLDQAINGLLDQGYLVKRELGYQLEWRKWAIFEGSPRPS